MGIIKDLGEEYVDVQIGREVIMVGTELRANKEITVSGK